MNAKAILEQLMQQSEDRAGSRGSKETARGSAGTVEKLLRGLTSQLGGGSGSGQGSGMDVKRLLGGAGQRGGMDMKSLLGSGALALLIGSKRGRKLGGKALRYGALAGIGGLAWKAWQNYQAEQNAGAGDAPREGEPVERLQGDAGERRSLEILQAMIMTARADGHVDQTERTLLTQQMEALGADAELRDWMEQQLERPLDAEALARHADSPQAAREMYVASLAIADEQNPMERAWLEQLASALNIDPELAAELERQVETNA